MLPIFRAPVRASRARLFAYTPLTNSIPRRFAHSSYGNEQSGHPQGQNEANPKVDLEHPGPKTPAQKGSGTGSGSTSVSGSGSQSSSTQTQSGGSSSQSGNQEGSPAIHHPESAAEKDDPEVRKHNEEMAQRSDQSANQLSEDDNKVDKNFWKGNVGSDKEK